MKRYVLTLDCYVYADSDDQAIKICNIVKNELENLDTQSLIDIQNPAIVTIHEQPFGVIGNRKIYPE